MDARCTDSAAPPAARAAGAPDIYDAACLRLLGAVFPSIAHDIRGRLNNIVFNLELMHSSVKAPPCTGQGEERSYRDIALQQVYQIDRLIQSLLELLDVTEQANSEFDMAALLNDVHDFIKTYARVKGVQLSWVPLPANVPVQSRRGQLRKSLIHLLLAYVNAARDKAVLHVEAAAVPGKVVVRARGERQGVDEAVLRALFAPERGAGAAALGAAARATLVGLGGRVELEWDEALMRLTIELPG